MDDQHNGGGVPPDETPHVVYPDDPESALHPDIEPPLPRALVSSGGGTRTPPPPPPDDEEDDEDSGMLRMSFMEHLEELRSRIIRAIAGFGVAFLLCLWFASPIWNYVQAPGLAAFKTIGRGGFIAIAPMEQFSIIWMWSPLVASLFIASPWVIYQVWAFIAPGLYPKERRWAVPFVLCTAGLFITGGLFAYFVAFRFALTFLFDIGGPVGVLPLISIDQYFDLFVDVMLGISLVFELPVLIFFLTLIRVASPAFLLRHSRYAILAIVILAAIITPTPDVFNLTLFAVPMILLYFMGVFASYLLVMRRENRRFPWRIFLYWLLSVLAVLALCVVVAIERYRYHITFHWPFLVK
jgi:sec-independent protein translocase protein TatC